MTSQLRYFVCGPTPNWYGRITSQLHRCLAGKGIARPLGPERCTIVRGSMLVLTEADPRIPHTGSAAV